MLSPRSCGMVAGRVVRGGFSQIILLTRFEHPGTGIYLPGLVGICYIVGVRTSALGRWGTLRQMAASQCEASGNNKWRDCVLIEW